MSKVSVVVPVFNEEEVLQRTIDSILSQTYENIEVILVDDGSTDQSLDICRKEAEMHSNIHVLTQTNSGVSSARNKGIEAATGKYISFIDADDTIDKNHIEKLVKRIETKDVDAIFPGYKMIYPSNVIYRKQRLKTGLYKKEQILKSLIDDGTMTGILFGSASMGIYKLEVIMDNKITFKKDLEVNEDGVFNIEYLLNSNTFFVDNEIYTYNYYQRTESNPNYLELKRRLQQVDQELEVTFDDSIPNLKEQLSSRKISVLLWLILSLCRDSRFNYPSKRKEMKKLFNDYNFEKNSEFVNYDQLPVHKKIYFILMKYKQYFLLYICTRYLTPIFSGVLNR